MKIKEAYISNTIDSAKDKIQYDEHVRQILKDKGILAYILKYAVKEFSTYILNFSPFLRLKISLYPHKH